jgi:hypothetical protein
MKIKAGWARIANEVGHEIESNRCKGVEGLALRGRNQSKRM